MSEPTPDFPIGDAFHWEAVPDTLRDWSTEPWDLEFRFCRFGRDCGRRAVAVMFRGRSRQRWGYCDLPGHMYGRWVEEDTVMHWVVRPNASEAQQ